MTVDPSELIGSFYEAAFDPTRFPEVLRQLGAFANGIGGVLVVWDKRAGQPALLATGGHLGDDAADAYYTHYAALDPYRPLVEALPTGVWTPCATCFDDRFVAGNVFFNEYLIPRGTRYMCAARVHASDTFDTYLGVHRGPRHEPFSHDETLRLERIGRQFGRAVRLYLDVAHTRLGHEATAGGLERLAKPALLVDPACRVLYANPAAEALLRTTHVITVDRGRLAARARVDSDRLQQLVDRATHGRTGGDMRLSAPAGLRADVLTVTPAGPVSTLYSLAPVALALVVFQEPRDAAPSGARLQALFGLTNAEAALAQGLADGKRLTEIAAARRVSIETVRTQLRSLFRKTGATRQPDLVRILLAARDKPPAP
jgi:DNA-binding CsgD family transcriptional regulator